ncbi:biosynthetic-type acetolactate synthase large subunit [Anaerosphaera multitolerans]|uniref:Acetolactate synthase n=1 Tax=Anaerosphaera multitolerans TaxID=2487351 RepID=A0A437S6H8_9FIRM|nr:biosynthetic-type acetolactate synthase large subunit [Anaerosphaera multitolerans]RVU54601.1 biosynthetic-type acetolactate synthase large subunit [Anaerosphaera multitolerans]
MKYKGAEIIIKTLIDQGVDTIFGYPGGAIIDIYDALYDYKDKINHILTCDEQGAAHAADGYGRSTGKTGVALATSGPGATNLVTGIATAFMDSIPMVCITGNVPMSLIGKDSFQEIYITGITMPITKHNFLVSDINELQDTIRRAFKIANTGRKGPVLVDVPKNVILDYAEYEPKEKIVCEPKSDYNLDELKELAEIINKSERPFIYCGGGVTASESYKELRDLIKKNKIPACNTLMAIGVLDYDDELNFGMVGMHGKVSSNYAIENADLLIAIGARFSDRVALNTKKFAPHAKIVQLDIDKSEIDKNVLVDFGVVGDIKVILRNLLPMIEERNRSEWLATLRDFKTRDYVPKDSDEILKPHQIINYVSEKLGEDFIMVTDVGQHQMWAAQYCGKIHPRSFLTSAGLGTMGFGYGASIGAKVANPEKPVVLVSGDGSFHMNMNEVTTAVKYGIKIIAIVMNNDNLGMVRQWQHFLYEDRYSHTDNKKKTDYVKLADAFGAKGYSCSTIEEFKESFNDSLKVDVPVIIEVKIDEDEAVLPMIPAGGTVDDLILG